MERIYQARSAMGKFSAKLQKLGLDHLDIQRRKTRSMEWPAALSAQRYTLYSPHNLKVDHAPVTTQTAINIPWHVLHSFLPPSLFELKRQNATTFSSIPIPHPSHCRCFGVAFLLFWQAWHKILPPHRAEFTLQ